MFCTNPHRHSVNGIQYQLPFCTNVVSFFAIGMTFVSLFKRNCVPYGFSVLLSPQVSALKVTRVFRTLRFMRITSLYVSDYVPTCVLRFCFIVISFCQVWSPKFFFFFFATKWLHYVLYMYNVGRWFQSPWKTTATNVTGCMAHLQHTCMCSNRFILLAVLKH